MNRHPSHQLAQTAMYAAEELRGYMNPDDPFPWELTDDDHLALLPCLRKAVWDIAECIDGIAKATPEAQVKGKLAESAEDLQAGCDGIELAERDMRRPESGPDTLTQPAALAASSFPQPVTADLLREAATAAPLPGNTAAVPRAGTASPRKTR